MATQEEVIQKVNDYCTERQYTLNDSFRNQFSEKFANANAEADINDENISKAIKFNLDTAFSATSKGIQASEEIWKKEKAELVNQINELKSKGNSNNAPKKDEPKFEVPEELKKELAELKEFKANEQIKDKRMRVFDLAKKNVREDLHDDLNRVFNIMQVDYNKSDDDLAKQLNNSFVELYKNRIGDTRPTSSENLQKRDSDMLAGVKKVKI